MTARTLFRSCGFALLALSAWGASAPPAEHLQIGGEWCFIQAPAGKANPAAVILIHGNGESVGPETSSWEHNPGTRLLMDRLLAAGYLVAQSNAAALPSNGMWGNPATQQAVTALMGYLRANRGVTAFDAIALSAGNLTLLNLALSGEANFGHAVLTAPVISLVSLYRCPGGFERVNGISAAFGFTPARACPGDPEHDPEFLRRTAASDPLRVIDGKRSLLTRLAGTRWLSCYEEKDPKVPPPENILALQDRFREAKIPLRTWALPNTASHGSREMFEGCVPEILDLLH